MNSSKLKIAIVMILLIAASVFFKDAWREKGSRKIVFEAVAVERSGVTGLPVGRCLPPDSVDEISKHMRELVSYENELDRPDTRTDALSGLAQVSFDLGEHGVEKADKLQWYQKGVHYAEVLINEHPKRVEGYYWRAMNLCGICEISRAAAALSMLPDIIKTLKSAVDIDNGYDQAGPPRVLGRILGKAPPWPISEGDADQSLVLLRLAVKISPENSTNHLYLAEALIDKGDFHSACKELDFALDSRCHATSPLRLREDKEQALSLMTNCATRVGGGSVQGARPTSAVAGQEFAKE